MNGKTHIELYGYLNIEGLGQVAVATYVFQKLDINPLDDSIKRYGWIEMALINLL